MNIKMAIALLLAFLFSTATEAQTDPCPKMNDLWGEAMEAETNAPTGEAAGGITVADVLRRLIAGVEGVGLEEGETSATLTWNLSQRLAALFEVLNEPELYGSISEAIQDDSLREFLSGRVGPGDDLTFTLRYVHKGSGGSNDTSAGAQMMMGRAGAFQRYHSFGDFAQTYLRMGKDYMKEPLRGRNSDPCPSDTDLQEMRRELSKYTAVVMNVSEGEARIYYKQRDSLVGPSQWGLSAKYTMALGKANKHQETLRNLFFRFGNLWRDTLPHEPSSVAPSANVDWSGEDAKTMLRQQRLSFQVSYDESEDYSFGSFIPDPISQDRSRALVGTAAYSLEFPGDNADSAKLPRYEVQLSYEDVDSDPARQNRFVARALISKGLTLTGEAADLSFGIVYASEPEFLIQEDVDQQLSARLGLRFRFGGVGGNQSGQANGQ